MALGYPVNDLYSRPRKQLCVGTARPCYAFHLDKSITKDRFKCSWGPGKWRWPDHSCPLKPLALLISAPLLPRGNVSPGFSDLLAVQVWVIQLCLTLCDPMDYNLPGSSVHGILQTRILEWVAIPLSRGSSRPRDGTQVSCIAGRFITIWATREAWLYKGNRKIQSFKRNLPHLKFCQFKNIKKKKQTRKQPNQYVCGPGLAHYFLFAVSAGKNRWEFLGLILRRFGLKKSWVKGIVITIWQNVMMPSFKNSV